MGGNYLVMVVDHLKNSAARHTSWDKKSNKSFWLLLINIFNGNS